jgi:hypothetical protein
MMTKSFLSRFGRLAAVVALVGAGLIAAVASAAPSGAATSAFNGRWTDYGAAMPGISVGGSNGTSVVVDMSYAHRPSGTGTLTNATTIVVNFPDAGRITGTLQGSNVIRWSNGSSWQKVYSGAMVFDINNQAWTDGARPWR